MVIVRDLAGNIIGKEASQSYVSTRTLRNAHERKLCDAQMGIVRETPRNRAELRLQRVNDARVSRGLDPIYDNPGLINHNV